LKIVLSTFGTRGDVQPMLALSLGLQTAGHEVLLVGPPENAAWADKLGCPYQPAGSDVTAIIDTVEAAHTFKASLVFRDYVRRKVVLQFEMLPRLMRGADMLVAGSLCYGLPSIAEALQIPYRFIAFTPQMIPSAHHPFPAMRSQRLPRWCNRIAWRLLNVIQGLRFTRQINGYRRNMGLAPVGDINKHIMNPAVVVASDPAVAAVPHDIEINAIQTGYMHLKEPVAPLPELDAYLAQGPAPIYFGFGSMPPIDTSRLVPLIVDAARCAGFRAVISRKPAEPDASQWGDDVFFINGYPHTALFPKMAAVVHHGGAGTTAAAAISGVPQVIVPHILDQFYWGECIRRSKLGPPPIWRSKLTAAKLVKALRICTESRAYRQNAIHVSRKIRRNDAIERTIHAILASY
jgi:UDP:flavonoid glycosyltransferase YjiC (YdhE family)